MKIGDRVACFLSHDEDQAFLIGFGDVVAVDDVPPPTVPAFGRTWPKIQIDGGPIVWSCECSVVDETEGRKIMMNAKTTEHVNSDDFVKLRDRVAKLAGITSRPRS